MSSKATSGWAGPDVSVSADNLLWKQYVVYVDLFRFYVDIAWRSSVWFYGITGALLAFYFDRVERTGPYLAFALLLPVAFSVGFCVLYLRGARQVADLRIKLDYIRDQLNLPGRPHVEFLYDFLRWAAVLFALVGACLGVVLVLGIVTEMGLCGQ
jgi:hypothetical protein